MPRDGTARGRVTKLDGDEFPTGFPFRRRHLSRYIPGPVASARMEEGGIASRRYQGKDVGRDVYRDALRAGKRQS